MLVLFKPSTVVQIDKEEIRQKLAARGKLSSMEIRTIVWLVIAVMGIVFPAILIFTFHYLDILVGQGEGNRMYTQKEVLRLGIPLTVVVFIIVLLVEIPWWKLIGLA